MRLAAPSIMTAAVMVVMAIGSASADIPWQSDLRSAHAQAQGQGKLILLHFFSDNCVWCDKLEETSFASSDVSKAIDKQYVPVKVHAGKNPKLTEMFKVTKFPTDVIVTPAGKTLAHQVSPQQPSRYVAMLTGAAKSMASNSVAQTPAGVAAKQASARLNPTPPAPKAELAAAMPTPVKAKPATQPAPVVKVDRPTVKAPEPKAQLASSRSNAMDLSKTTDAEPSVPRRTPELAIQGFCPVTVIKEDKWVEGNPKTGVIHLGRLYLFASDEAMQTFLADPVPYTPVLNEIDVVRFFEEKKVVSGKREWGLKDPTHNRMFFFADEAAMNHFWNEYERYTGAAIEVMEKAVNDANPGS